MLRCFDHFCITFVLNFGDAAPHCKDIDAAAAADDDDDSSMTTMTTKTTTMMMMMMMMMTSVKFASSN